MSPAPLRKAILPVFLSALAALVSAPGCATPRARLVETFREGAGTWAVLAQHGGEGPRVRNGRLELEGFTALRAPVTFQRPAGHVDLALTGGDPRGFAGLFLLRPESRRLEVLALRGTGEWRHYTSEGDPFIPVGGRGWIAGPAGAAVGFHRLAVRPAGGALSFLLDGVEVARLEEPAPPAGAGWQIGLFTRGAEAWWKNLVFGEEGDPEFDPGAFDDWGAQETAQALLGELDGLVEALRRRPTRSGILAFAAVAEIGLRIAEQHADAGLRSRFLERIKANAADLRRAASRAGEEDLLLAALEGLALEETLGLFLGRDVEDLKREAGEALAAGRTADALIRLALALELGRDRDLESRFTKLKSSLPELTYAFLADFSRARDPIVTEGDFSRVVLETYGGLRRASPGRIRIAVRIDRAQREEIVENAQRTLFVTAGSDGLSPESDAELSRLREELEDGLVEAQARADVLRTSSEVLGPGPLASLRVFRIRGRDYTFHIDDGRRLVEIEKRIRELEERRRRAQRSRRQVRIQARRRTVSVLVEFSCALAYGGRILGRLERDRTYRGLEQWEHPADPERGVPKASFDAGEVEAVVGAVRRRVLARFRNLIAKEYLVSRLEPQEKLPFLIALARATRLSEDVSALKWYLRQTHGLRGLALERVCARLLD